jgi:heme exporter protein A
MKIVSARGLVQRFGRHLALGPLDLSLEAGERLAVLGDNGAGKTTLLRLLGTVARPASGRLELFGLDPLAHRDRVRPRLGFLGHQPGLYGGLSALENLEFFATLHGLGSERAAAALEEVGLLAFAGSRVEELSRGLQQRLAVARALLHSPELLVLDEPDASLDSSARSILGAAFEGRTVVMATHDRTLARELCGRGLLLKAGLVAGDPWGLRVLEPNR